MNYPIDLQKNNERSSNFNTYLDESIETIYTIGPYLTSDKKHKIISQRWYNYETFSDYLISKIFFFGVDFDEVFQELVLLKRNEIIGVARIQRNRGDFLSLRK